MVVTTNLISTPGMKMITRRMSTLISDARARANRLATLPKSSNVYDPQVSVQKSYGAQSKPYFIQYILNSTCE